MINMPFIESGNPQKRDIYLGTPPKYFAILSEHNGHMTAGMKAWKRRATSIRSGAMAFWNQCTQEIVKAGHVIIRGQPHHHHPDHTFNADQSTCFINENGEKIALASRMKNHERQGEVKHVSKMLREANFLVVPSDCIREGTGDTLFDPNTGVWFMGVGMRTARGAGKQLSTASGRPVIELPTQNDHFYHLDTFLSFLPLGHFMAYKGAMTAASYHVLEMFYPDPDNRLELTRAEAMSLAANVQIIASYQDADKPQHHVAVPSNISPRVLNWLKALQYEPKLMRSRALGHAGGGIHCSFQRVWDLRDHPLRPLPPDLIEYIQATNRVLPERKRINVWVAGERISAANAANPPINAQSLVLACA